MYFKIIFPSVYVRNLQNALKSVIIYLVWRRSLIYPLSIPVVPYYRKSDERSINATRMFVFLHSSAILRSRSLSTFTPFPFEVESSSSNSPKSKSPVPLAHKLPPPFDSIIVDKIYLNFVFVWNWRRVDSG